MDNNMVLIIRKRMEGKATEELLRIFQEHDRTQYTEEAFEAVRQLLQERGFSHVHRTPQSINLTALKNETMSLPVYDTRTAWYKRPWFTILSLVCLPPIGLILLWSQRTWSTGTKIGFTFLGLFCWAGIASNSSLDTNDTSSHSSTTNVSTSAAQPISTSPEQQIEELIKDRFGDKLREVRVTPQQNGGFGVFAAFNMSDNLTTSMTKRGVEIDMRDAYKALYTSPYDVRQAKIVAYGPLQDKFGNGSQDAVFTTSMNSDVGNKINWDNYMALDFNQLWKVSFIHPAFRRM